MKTTLWISTSLVLTLACSGPPREVRVPLPPDDALTRAVRILESFDYRVLSLDREGMIIRGVRRSDDRGPETLWQVAVHVIAEAADSRALYRLESRAASAPDPESEQFPRRGLGWLRMSQVPPHHLNAILAALADWRR